MPSSKKPKKKYRPKGCIPNPVEYVLSGFKAPPTNQMDSIRVKNRKAMYSLTHGSATYDDWLMVTNVLNLAMALAVHVYEGQEYVDDINAAMEAHARCGARVIDGKTYGYTGQQLQAVNRALEIHDAQLDMATVGEIEDAHRSVVHLIQNNKFAYRAKDFTASATSGSNPTPPKPAFVLQQSVST